MANVQHSLIVFNFSWIAMASLAPISIATNQFTLPTTGYTPYLIFGLMLVAFWAQIFQTKATQMEQAGVVSVIRGCTEVSYVPTLDSQSLN